MATAQIRFTGDSREARASVSALETELEGLQAEFKMNTTASDSLARQSRTTSVSVEALERNINEIRNETLQYRTTLTQLNAELAQNRQALLSADAASREALETRNRQIQSEQRFLRVRQQTTAISLRNIQDQRRELLGISNSFQETARSGGIFRRSLDDITGALGAFGIIEVAAGVGRFARESVNAAVRVEGFRNSLTALYGDAQIAERTLSDLQDLAQLPGITFQGAVEGAIRLKTVQREGQAALDTIREFGNAAALSGATTIEMNRALVGFTQTLARGQIEQDNLNQILENVPLIGNAIREAFGSIDAETIREQLDAAGQSVTDFADILVNQLSMGARASADTAANAFSNLNNAVFELQSTIGERLLPIVADSTRGLTGFLEAITRFLDGSSFATKSAEEFTEAISGTTASVQALLPELDEYIRTLEQQQRSRGGISSGQLEDLNEARDLYRLVSSAVMGNTDAVAELESRVNTAKTTLDAYNAEQERLKTAIDDVDPSIRAERDSLIGLNQELAENTRSLSEAQTDYDGLNRVLTSATEKVTTLREGISAAEPPTMTLRTATVSLTESIRELPPEITSVRTAFDVLAPTTARVNAIFTEYNETLGRYVAVSGIVVSSAEEEAEALDAVTESIIQQTQDAEALSHVQEVLTQRTDAHNAALVNPAVSDAVESFRDYSHIIGDVNLGYDEIIPATQDFIDGLVRQKSAFDDLRDAAEAAEISLDDIDETFNRIPDPIDTAIVSMEDFETVALRALREIGDELSAFEGDLGGVGVGIDNLVTLFANPVSFAAGTLGAVIEGLSAINEFGGALGLPEGFFDDPVRRQARVNPQNVAQSEQLEQDQIHQAGIARNLNVADPLSQIEILRGNDPGIFQRHNTRAFIEENFPELVDVIYPSGRGFNASGVLSRQADARSLSERTGTDRQATEDAAILMYGPEDYAAEVAAATGEALSDIPEPDLPPEIADPLGTFSLTRDEREVLSPYETAVREAENAIEDLTADSTPQEIADAYQALVFAQTNLSSITEGIIRAAADVGRITGTAATNAITTLGLDLGDDLRTANNALIRSLGNVGFEVVGGIENIREAIDVSDISSTFRRIPEEVEEAAAEAEPETAPALREVFSFSAGQRRILDPLNDAVSDAEEFIRDFITEDSTPEEIQAAYTALTTAEQALYNQQVEFITNATHITEETRTGALAAAGRDFNGDIRDANQTLVRALGTVGFELVNALTFTSGILMGSAAAIQRIPEEVEATAEETAADVDTDDPIAGLRSNTRLAANQVRRSRTALGQATSESDFETRRIDLIQSINAAYTAQIALLDALGLSEADYQDRFEDAEDARDSAITRATTATNTFAEARIKGEEDVAEAAQDAADERIAAEERAERERMRLSERQAREELRIQERLEADIEDLRDEQIENAEKRADALVEIAEDHQQRLEDIEQDGIRAREDLQTDRRRALEDLLADGLTPEELQGFRQEQGLVSGSTFEDDARENILEQLRSGEITGQEAERFIGRGAVDQFTSEQRAIEDAELRAEQARESAEIQAAATTEALQTALMPLIAMETTTAELESKTAIMQADTVSTQADTALTEMATAETAMASFGIFDAGVENFNVGVDTFNTAANTLQSAAEHLLSVQNSSGSERPRIFGAPPIGSSGAVGGGDALFHNEQLDRRLRFDVASAARRAPAPDYIVTDNQRRNAHDIGREITAGVTEALDARGARGGGLQGELNSGGLDREIIIRNVLELPDNAISELNDNVVRLKDQNRSL